MESSLKKITYIVLSLIFSVVILVVVTNIAIKEENKADAHTVPDTTAFSTSIPNDYVKLLGVKTDSASGKNKFQFVRTVLFKHRSPISYFIYENAYRIQIYKMDSLCHFSLNKLVHESYGNAKQDYYTLYSLEDDTTFKYFYKLSLPPKPDTIYLKLLGKDNRTMIKNDSVAYYYTKACYFSIKYNLTYNDDIYGEAKDGNYQPLELLFLKKGKFLYLAIMAVCKQDGKYPPGLLYNLINSNNDIP